MRQQATLAATRKIISKGLIELLRLAIIGALMGAAVMLLHIPVEELSALELVFGVLTAFGAAFVAIGLPRPRAGRS